MFVRTFYQKLTLAKIQDMLSTERDNNANWKAADKLIANVFGNVSWISFIATTVYYYLLQLTMESIVFLKN